MAYEGPHPLPVKSGGTGRATLTNHGVLVGAGTTAITQLAAAASGTVLIGNTAADPSFSTTPSVTSMTVTDAPVAGTDAANKSYVDSVAAGFTFEASSFAATTANLNATYANGAAGVGATLTNAGAMAAFSTDGESPLLNDRVLVKDQTNQEENGIYTLTTVGSGAVNWVLTRATDYDTAAEIQPGTVVPVTDGTLNAGTTWLETATVTTVGTDPVVFSRFTGGSLATFNTDSGTATVSGSSITMAGGSNLNTSGAGSTVTYNLNTSPSVSGSLTAGTTVTAGTGITATTGNIAASSGNVSASGTVTAGTTMTAGTGITATTGNIAASSGNVTASALMSAGTTITAGTGLIATTGGLKLSDFIEGALVTSVTGVASSVTGTAGYVLTANAAGTAPSFQAAPSSAITITGDTGGPLVGTSFIFTGGTTGLSFGGAGSTETLTFAGITANGGTVSLATDATTSTINVGTGAGVKTSTFGSTNSTSTTTVQSGSGALNVTSTNGALTVNSGTGTLGVSTDAAATTVNLGTGAGVKTVTLGSTNSTSPTTVQSGSGALNITSTNGAITANSGTGTLGVSTDATATTVNIGTGAGAKTVTVGSTNTTSATVINAGSGGVKVPTLTAGLVASSSLGLLSSIAITNHSLLVGNSSSTASSLGAATNGQIPIGSTGNNPVLATITQGSGITVTNGAGTITIAATGTTPASTCNFFAYLNTTQNNWIGGNTSKTIVLDSTLYDVGSNFNTGTYTFTAPATGYYHFTASVALNDIPSTETEYFFSIVTTTNTYGQQNGNLAAMRAINGGANSYGVNMAITCAMTSGNTAYCVLLVGGTSGTTMELLGNSGGAGSQFRTSFTGFRIS